MSADSILLWHCPFSPHTWTTLAQIMASPTSKTNRAGKVLEQKAWYCPALLPPPKTCRPAASHTGEVCGSPVTWSIFRYVKSHLHQMPSRVSNADSRIKNRTDVNRKV